MNRILTGGSPRLESAMSVEVHCGLSVGLYLVIAMIARAVASDLIVLISQTMGTVAMHVSICCLSGPSKNHLHTSLSGTTMEGLGRSSGR